MKIALAVAALFSLTGDPVAAPPSAEEAMKKADVAMSAASEARDIDAFLEQVADDALFFGPGDPARGHDGVRRAWGPFFEEDGPSLTWAPSGAGASAAGDLGWTVGEGVYKDEGPDGKAIEDHPHYVTIWRRAADGAYRAEADFGNRGTVPEGAALKSIVKRASADGSLEYEVSSFELTDRTPTGPRYAQALVVRRRSPDGTWKTELSAWHPTRIPTGPLGTAASPRP